MFSGAAGRTWWAASQPASQRRPAELAERRAVRVPARTLFYKWHRRQASGRPASRRQDRASSRREEKNKCQRIKYGAYCAKTPSQRTEGWRKASTPGVNVGGYALDGPGFVERYKTVHISRSYVAALFSPPEHEHATTSSTSSQDDYSTPTAIHAPRAASHPQQQQHAPA